MTDTAVFVKSKSTVPETQPSLYSWDSLSRKFFSEYEFKLVALKSGVASLYQNPLTSFRDPV
jgi:hypothetical protein